MKCRVQYLLECYSGENFVDLSEDVERTGESEDHADWKLYQASDSILPVIGQGELNARDGPLNFGLRQSIRGLARKLKSAADSLNVRPRSALLSIERAILLNEGLNHDEMQVVKNILSEKTPTTVSKIAEHLEKYMTYRTFHAALRYLCYSATSVPEELALSCELVKLTFPKIKQLSRTDSVYDVISEIIDDKLDGVLH